jgi:predicted lipoprotein
LRSGQRRQREQAGNLRSFQLTELAEVSLRGLLSQAAQGYSLDIQMHRKLLLPLMLVVAFGLPSCKVVKTPSGTTKEASGRSQSGGGDPIAKLAAESFEAKLLPLIAEKALSVGDLRANIAAGLDTAGTAHGNRGAGVGAAWNFAVKGEGVIISANLTSRARKAEVDTTGDGAPDLTLLLGPVINGTSLRDVAPFYDFGSFRDQIEFAQLARALNDLDSATFILPEGDLIGKTISFQGVVPLKSATDTWVVTASSAKVQP